MWQLGARDACRPREPAAQVEEDALAIHEPLEELEQLGKRAAQVVQLRFFGGAARPHDIL